MDDDDETISWTSESDSPSMIESEESYVTDYREHVDSDMFCFNYNNMFVMNGFSSEYVIDEMDHFDELNETYSEFDEDTEDLNESESTLSNNEEIDAGEINETIVISDDDTKPEISEKNVVLPKCPICFDTLKNKSIASTKCGHLFCLSCIKEVMKTKPTKCPTCRAVLRGAECFHQIFI